MLIGRFEDTKRTLEDAKRQLFNALVNNEPDWKIEGLVECIHDAQEVIANSEKI